MNAKSIFLRKAFMGMILFSLSLATSCKKEVVDTIYPGNYFPAYPGSYWNYINSDGETSAVTVENEYQLHSYSTSHSSQSETQQKLVPKVVPGGYLYGYSFKRSAGIYTGTDFTILKEELNGISSYNYAPYSAGGVITRKTVNVDTTIVVNDVSYYPTIQVNEFEGPYGTDYLGYLDKIYYYTENVGLIKMEDCSYHLDNDSIHVENTLSLVDHNINL